MATFYNFAQEDAPALSPDKEVLAPSKASTSNEVPSVLKIGQEQAKAFIIPIKGPIDDSVLYLVRRGVKEAKRIKADAIVLDMDTPGGAVDTTEEIIKNISGLEIPTYTFVEFNAISAGAIIACATDKIYMKEGSKIGDAMPVIPSPQGGMQPLADAEREKVESYVDTLVRSIAEATDRDPALLSCMVRRDLEYKIGDDVICKEGQLLTLTNNEAARTFGEDQKPLLSEGTASDIESMLAADGLAHAKLVNMDLTWSEGLYVQIAKFSPLLIGIGIFCMMASVYNPSLTIPGIGIGVLCFTLFFFGHHIAGLSGNTEAVIFIIGLIFIALEVFVIPGFGFAGITGIALVMGAILAAMVQVYPGAVPINNNSTLPGLPAMSDLKAPIYWLSGALVFTAVGAWILTKFVNGSPVFTNRLVLKQAIQGRGEVATVKDINDLVGQVAKTITPLRPSGTIILNNQPLDVFTQGDFIDEGEEIRILTAVGNRIIVERT